MSSPQSKKFWRAVAVFVLGLATSAAPSALANDSTAELGTGGLDFVYNENVEMRSEQLFISTEQVRVTYHFFNKSDKPVTNLVAFPLPDVTIPDQDSNASVPTEEPVNFLAFSTQVNGQSVTTQVEQKAFAKGLDRTAMLQGLGIPLAPQLKATDDALDKLPRDKWDDLVNLGIAEISEYGNTPDGKMQQHLEPRWTLKTTYYWQQTFPAQQETVIEHQYKPSVGASAGTEVGATLQTTDAQFAAEQKRRLAAYTAKYCMDTAFVAAAKQAQQNAAKLKNAYVSEQRIDYILRTGANWAGPIADFTLTVDKGKPDNLISFCGTGIKKLSPTQFQVHYKDYTPTADLAVLILTTNVAQ
ncbi:MAG TPA: DUF4424 domain-containing protein [Stellaceae bacterium]|nr:DUF4424 domain-containing protein [Stellaceae bacterium]